MVGAGGGDGAMPMRAGIPGMTNHAARKTEPTCRTVLLFPFQSCVESGSPGGPRIARVEPRRTTP